MRKLADLNWPLAVVAVNILVTMFLGTWKLDLTADRIHTLSAVSRKYIGDLSDIVEVELVATGKLPAEYQNLNQGIGNILKEMATINPAKFRLKVTDPGDDSSQQTRVEQAGISPIQFSQMSGDKFEISKGYLGVILRFGEKIEVLPVAVDTGNLEYFVLSGIRRLTEDKKTVVGVAGSNLAGGQRQWWQKVLQGEYELVAVDLSDPDNLPSNLEVVVIDGEPAMNSDAAVMEKTIKSVNKIVDQKIGLVIFTDRILVDQQMNTKKSDQSAWWEWLTSKGVKVGESLIRDENSAIASFQTGQGSVLTQYTYWLMVGGKQIARNMPVVSALDRLLMPWVSPMEIADGFEPLLWSSERSTLDTELSDISPDKSPKAVETELSQKVVAAINPERRMVVVADGDFLNDEFVSTSQSNLLLAFNMVDFVGGSSDWLTIRSKVIKSYPLPTLSAADKIWFRIINLGLPLLIIAGSALLVYKRRRINSRRLKQEWQEN